MIITKIESTIIKALGVLVIGSALYIWIVYGGAALKNLAIYTMIGLSVLYLLITGGLPRHHRAQTYGGGVAVGR